MYPQQPASAQFSPQGSHKTLTIVILTLLLIGSLIFGGWAYAGRQSYKNDSDKKAAVAVEAAKKEQTAQLQAQFAEQSKSPNKTFTGSPTYGSITFNYPKTWSAYLDSNNTSEPINGYFHPDVVPGTQSKVAFALRVELVNTDYSQIVQQFTNSSQKKVTASAYLPPKMNGVANAQPGTLFTGAINNQDQTQNGALLAIKVRDKTLEISTQSNDYMDDFNNIILASLTFAP